MAMFIDGALLQTAAHELGFEVDYKLLLEVFAKRASLARIFYYVSRVCNSRVDFVAYNLRRSSAFRCAMCSLSAVLTGSRSRKSRAWRMD